MAKSTKKAARSAKKSASHTVRSAENAARANTYAMKDFVASGAQKAQEKVYSMGREGAAKIAQGADKVNQIVSDAVAASRDNLETCIECGNKTASFVKELSSEALESANQALSDNIEVSKELFACRTISDMLELQNRLVRQSMDNFFSRSAKLSDMMFEYTTDALEPINERVAQATDHFSRTLSKAA